MYICIFFVGRYTFNLLINNTILSFCEPSVFRCYTSGLQNLPLISSIFEHSVGLKLLILRSIHQFWMIDELGEYKVIDTSHSKMNGSWNLILKLKYRLELIDSILYVFFFS